MKAENKFGFRAALARCPFAGLLAGLALVWLPPAAQADTQTGAATTVAATVATTAVTAANAAPAAAPPGWPDLSARYRVSFQAPGAPVKSQPWQISRSATEITWFKDSGTEEIWRRDADAPAHGIRLERVLRQDRHIIEYSAGELRTLGVVVDWQALGTVLPEAELARLKRQDPPQRRPGATAPQRRPGATAPQHYRGKLGAEQVDLVWDPVARLPIRLVRQGPTGRVVYQRLAVITPPAQPDWPSAGAGTDDFQRLDAADFGDMDYNNVVRKQQARDERAGWRTPHRH